MKTGDWSTDINQKFIANNRTAQLRATLLEEETHELVNALYNEDLHQVRKELCDVLYVAFAIAAIYNLNIDDDFQVVHRNNMLKFLTGKLREDGKWIKSPDHPKVVFPVKYEDEYGLHYITEKE